MEEKLREAACFGDHESLVKLIAAGADVNGQHKVRRRDPSETLYF